MVMFKVNNKNRKTTSMILFGDTYDLYDFVNFVSFF